MILALLLGACATDLGTLSALAEEYATRTVEASTPGLRSSLALGALSAELCVDQASTGWSEVVVGEDLPLSAELAEVLDTPRVDSFSDEGAVIELSLSGLSLLDQTDARLRLKITDGSDTNGPLQISGTAVGATDETVLGTITYELGSDCAEIRTRLFGTAIWQLGETTHSYALPSADAEDSSLTWPGVVPWLPGAGSVKWTGIVDGQERSILTDDASEMVEDAGAVLWGAEVSGGGNERVAAWSARTELSLVP